jgi:hypothetical protein
MRVPNIPRCFEHAKWWGRLGSSNRPRRLAGCGCEGGDGRERSGSECLYNLEELLVIEGERTGKI